MKIPWSKVAQYGIPVVAALIGVAGTEGYHRTSQTPIEKPIVTAQLPVINLICEKTVMPKIEFNCPVIPPCTRCPDLIVR